jgi:hypothetical protein
VTHPRRLASPKHSLARARTPDVCLDLHKTHKTAPKIFTDETISHPCTVVRTLPNRFSISQDRPHAGTTKVIVPFFKRLYRSPGQNSATPGLSRAGSLQIES